jgi:hypothetical protein
LFAIWQGDEPHPFHEKKPIYLGCAHNLAELAHAEKRDKRDEHNNSGAKNHLKTNHVGFIPAPRGMGPEFVRALPQLPYEIGRRSVPNAVGINPRTVQCVIVSFRGTALTLMPAVPEPLTFWMRRFARLIVGIITPGVGALRVMMPVPPLVSIPAPSTPVMLIDVLMVTGL